MASYKGVVVSPSLTQTAGGKNLYVPSAAGSGPEVILGDVDITGDLAVQGGDVTILQTDRTTPSSAATLELSGGLGGDGAAGGSKYTFYKGCGPLGDGVIYPDHLQLFRNGPAGSVQPSTSQVLHIGPRMLPANPLLPAANFMSIFADVDVGGALTSSLGSFGATNPPVALAPTSQGVLGVFGGWKVAFGWQNLGPGINTVQVNFTTPFSGYPLVLVSNASDDDAGDLQIVRASTILTTSFLIKAFTVGGTGGGLLNASWIAIGKA